MQEAKRGAQWRLQPPIGGEIGRCNRHDGCFLNTARTDGIDINIWQEKMHESLTTRGRKEAWFSGVAAAHRVRCGEAYGILRRRHRCCEDTNPSSPGGEQGGIAPQEEDHSVVAVARPQGTAPVLLEPFRRLMQIAYRTYWVRELHQPRRFHSGPARQRASDRTTRPRMSSREDELKGESNEYVAKGGIGLQTSAGSGRGEYTATRS
jgi:hypothetical protein